MYLFKYITKGNAKVKVTLDNTDDVEKGDEIAAIMKTASAGGRDVSSHALRLIHIKGEGEGEAFCWNGVFSDGFQLQGILCRDFLND